MPTDRISKLFEDNRFLDQARFELVQVLRKTILGLNFPISGEVEGAGKLRRHIKLSTVQDLADKHAYIQTVRLHRAIKNIVIQPWLGVGHV